MCTVLIIQQMPANCVQAHDNSLEILPHIILYLSTRRPQTIGSPGHVRIYFLKSRISKNSVFQDQEFFSQNRQKIPHPLLKGKKISKNWIEFEPFHRYDSEICIEILSEKSSGFLTKISTPNNSEPIERILRTATPNNVEPIERILRTLFLSQRTYKFFSFPSLDLKNVSNRFWLFSRDFR